MTTRRSLLIRLAIVVAVVVVVVLVGSALRHNPTRHAQAGPAAAELSTDLPAADSSVPDPTSSTPPSRRSSVEASISAAFPSPTGPVVPATAAPVAAGATAAPTPGAGNDQTPGAAAVAAVVAWHSADTAVDSGPNASAVRAAAWLTPELLTQVQAFEPAAGPGVEWSTWAGHRAWLHVTAVVSGDDHPADTVDTAVRQVQVTITAVGRDGWTGPAEVVVDAVSLQRTAVGWRLAGLRPV